MTMIHYGVPYFEAREDILETLRMVREELDNRSDAEHIDGIPRGNWAMSLLEHVDRAIAVLEGK